MDVVADLAALVEKVVALPLEGESVEALLAAQSLLEKVVRVIPAAQHRIMAALAEQTGPVQVGGASWADVLAIRLGLSKQEARRRLGEGAVLAPRRAVTGQRLEPVYPVTAAAQARGELGGEHTRIITATMAKLPVSVEEPTRADVEARLAGLAAGMGPESLRRVANHVLAVLDPDGPQPNDEDTVARREMRRRVVLGRQDADGMTEIGGWITPECRAYLEPIFAKLAAPGMGDPADVSPCVTGVPSAEQIAADRRSLGQRQHDAVMTVARSVLSSGRLGQQQGLPVTVVVSATLADLEAAAGVGHTGGGATVPMRDLIRMAGHARHYLTVYDTHTNVPLYLGRAKRIASPGQRVVLYERDRGCTFPGCAMPGYLTQVHHAQLDYGKGGTTDIDNEALACGRHNRYVTERGWSTRINNRGRVEWIPPPHLDTGQQRINRYHHPEEFFRDD